MTWPELPFTDSSFVLALAALGFLVLPMVAERFRVPGLVGVLVAGALLGPRGFAVIDRSETIVTMGSAGLYYLMFMAGIELDLGSFKRSRHQTLTFGALTFLIPQVLGTVVFLALGFDVLASMLIASMFASHTLLSYPLTGRLGISRNRAVTMTVGGTLITDTVALMLLAIIAAAHQGALGFVFWLKLVGSMAALFVFVRYLLQPLSEWFFKRQTTSSTNDFLFVLCALFCTVAITRALGIEPILGAFFAGLVLNRLVPETSALNNRIHFFGNAFFIPFFLLSVGMLIDARVLIAGREVWVVAGAMVGATLAAKWLAAWIACRIFGFSRSELAVTFALSITQAAATLAATLVGLEIGLIGEDVLNGVIILIIVTCVVSPAVVQAAGRTVAREETERQASTTASTHPERVLIPMANPASADNLLDLAILLRGAKSAEPIQPLIVVTSELRQSASGVAQAERLLAHAVDYATAADVPVDPLTRVDLDPARGILRAAAERRSSTIVMGWDAAASRANKRIGRILDTVVDGSTQQVCLSQISRPVRMFERLVFVLPALAEYLPGFDSVVTATANLARGLRLPAVALVTEPDAEATLPRLTPLSKAAELELIHVAPTQRIEDAVLALVKPGDLVVIVGARRFSVAWADEAESIPARLSEAGVESFLLIYPPERSNREWAALTPV